MRGECFVFYCKQNYACGFATDTSSGYKDYKRTCNVRLDIPCSLSVLQIYALLKTKIIRLKRKRNVWIVFENMYKHMNVQKTKFGCTIVTTQSYVYFIS